MSNKTLERGIELEKNQCLSIIRKRFAGAAAKGPAIMETKKDPQIAGRIRNSEKARPIFDELVEMKSGRATGQPTPRVNQPRGFGPRMSLAEVDTPWAGAPGGGIFRPLPDEDGDYYGERSILDTFVTLSDGRTTSGKEGQKTHRSEGSRRGPSRSVIRQSVQQQCEILRQPLHSVQGGLRPAHQNDMSTIKGPP